METFDELVDAINVALDAGDWGTVVLLTGSLYQEAVAVGETDLAGHGLFAEGTTSVGQKRVDVRQGLVDQFRFGLVHPAATRPRGPSATGTSPPGTASAASADIAVCWRSG